MSIFITGDTHGEVIERFSFKHYASLRNLTENDTMIVAGDFGGIWDYNCQSRRDAYILDWMGQQKYHFLIVLGNHENWDAYETMPTERWNGGHVRACIYMNKEYHNIHIVDKTSIFDIEGHHILCIAGAESHDIQNLLDPEARDFEAQKKRMHSCGLWYRVKGQSWWPQEAVDIDFAMNFLGSHENEHFDLIVTHDAPGQINEWFSRGFGRYDSTEGERYLEVLRKTLDFDSWIHGHYHGDFYYPEPYDQRVSCIYKYIIPVF